MAVQPILLFPDEGLKQVCPPVAQADADAARLLTDLADTLY